MRVAAAIVVLLRRRGDGTSSPARLAHPPSRSRPCLHAPTPRGPGGVGRQGTQGALGQAGGLIETIVRMDSDLQALRGLKQRLDRLGG